jgi:hypothetical protein
MQNLPKMTILGRIILMGILIILFVSGCTCTSERLHPQFPSYRQSMGTMLVLVPEIGIFEQLPDGSRLFQDILEPGRATQSATIYCPTTASA